MSTEVQPPSPPDQSLSHLHKGKHSRFPPLAFNSRPARHGHIRSSSFGGFVSRLLPSRRQGRGHTLRSEFNDDGTHDPVELVFGLSESKSQNSLPGSESIDEMLARRTRSWSPKKNSGPSNDAWAPGALNNDQPSGIHNSLERPGRFADRDAVGISRRNRRTGGDEIQIVPSAADKRNFNTLKRMFGTINRARSAVRSESKCSESSSPQPPQIFEHSKPYLESFSANTRVPKTQQIFDEKRSQKEQRRSLRESGDFLGVQGANPRTGYWDISDATSSSEPSQMSGETKFKLDQQARELAEQKRKYEEAQELHQRELERVQTLKNLKKKEKGEQKKIELKMRQRRRGKWKLSEHGWSSVAEPDLSPIQQSIAGTPAADECEALAANDHGQPLLIGLAPGDRLFPMPCAAEPTPYMKKALVIQDDYFGHRVVSSAVVRQLPDQTTDASSSNPRSIIIPRKPVGSPSRHRNERSSDTIVHKDSSINPVPIQTSLPHPTQQTQVSSFPNPAFAIVGHDVCPGPPEEHPFLGKEALSSEEAGPYKRKATAISFRSASTRQVTVRPPLAQSLTVQRIISLNELPPVSLKDPITARIPSSYQIPKGPLPIWAPPTIIKTEADRPVSSINTSTIITTGCAPLQRLPGQVDGASDIQNDTPSREHRLQHKSSQIPLRTSSHQKNRERDMHGTLSPIHPVNTVTSSEHQLNLTKQRSIRLLQMSSRGRDRTELKSTPISISTSPARPEKQKETAQNAALLAYQQLRHQVAMKKTEGQIRGLLTPPKARMQRREDTRDATAKGVHKIAPGESGGTGSPSKIKREPGRALGASQTGRVGAVRVAQETRGGASDKLAAWRPELSAERNAGGREQEEAGAHAKASVKASVVLQKPPRPGPPPQEGGVATAKGGVPRPGGRSRGRGRGRPTRSVGQVIVGMAQRAWVSAEPVFDPHSGVRTRFARQRLTWEDVGSLIAAAVLMLGTLLATVVLARLVGIGWQVASASGAVLRLVSGS